MRSDYLPATAVCCICGHLIRENQINACIEGTITYVEYKFMVREVFVDPFVGYACLECRTKTQDIIRGGIEAARRRKDEEPKVGE